MIVVTVLAQPSLDTLGKNPEIKLNVLLVLKAKAMTEVNYYLKNKNISHCTQIIGFLTALM